MDESKKTEEMQVEKEGKKDQRDDRVEGSKIIIGLEETYNFKDP
jgi:hypothetical protein